jgi:putative toxin-antitoxin system antitoxin component (TIGR02293 family)
MTEAVMTVTARDIADVLAIGGAAPKSFADLERAVERGFAVASLDALRAALAVPGSPGDVELSCVRAIVSEPTLRRRREQGRLSADESDKAERLAAIIALARQVLGDEERARAFLTKPHPLLDGRPPALVATTDAGARRVDEVLRRIEWGLPA